MVLLLMLSIFLNPFMALVKFMLQAFLLKLVLLISLIMMVVLLSMLVFIGIVLNQVILKKRIRSFQDIPTSTYDIISLRQQRVVSSLVSLLLLITIIKSMMRLPNTNINAHSFYLAES